MGQTLGAVILRGGCPSHIRFAVPQPAEWQRLGDQIDAAMILARADLVNVQRRNFLSQSQAPFGGGNISQFVRNLAPDFTHYIREAHEKHMRTHNRQPTRSHRAENGENPDRSVHYYDRAPEKPTEEQPPPESRNKERRNQLLLLAVLIVVVGLVGTLVWDLSLQDKKVPGCEHNAVLGITIFIQAMIAFFGILNLDESHTTKVSPLTKGGMRGAITGAVIVTYVSLVIFHTMVEFATGQPTKDLTKDSFVNSFTAIVNITIIFYFASEAAIHWINHSKRKECAWV